MAKLTEARSSAIAFDGSSPLFINGGEVTLSSVTQHGTAFLVPWNCTLERMYYNVRTVATITTAVICVGTTADDDSLINDYVLELSTAGVYEIPLATSNSAFVSSDVDAGSLFYISYGTGATAIVSALAVLTPR